jgi:predicted permease
VRRLLLRLVSLFRSGRAEADLAREIDAHLQMLEDAFVAKGMSAEEAQYAARRAFGGVEQAKEHQRDARGLRWLAGFGLDFRLGLRMLVKYPGLTIVGGLGIAVGVAIGATSFAFLYASLHPTLPLDEGERIVGLENWDTSRNNQEDRNLHDFEAWRVSLKSVQEVSAFRMRSRNLIAADGRAQQVGVAEMTASGFRVARVAPILGRYLSDDDEQPGAPPVVVIGHDVWRTRFDSDPEVAGKTVHLGSVVHTVVGVMPERFAFPIDHRLWVPFRLSASDYERRRGPAITMFARLAPGATLDEANAELTAIGRRAAADSPKTHERLRPRVVRYTELWFDDGARAEMDLVQGLVTLLLVIVCVNVSVLVYARTAMRQGEIALRAALGASRRRIVAQLFTETLVLSLAAAAGGLALAWIALRQANAIADRLVLRFETGAIPFWMDFGLSPGTIVYTFALVLLAAAIVGVLPAVKATGGPTQPGLRHVASGSGLRFGGTSTALIVVQVACAVAVLPGALSYGWQSMRLAAASPGFAAEEFLTARVTMDADEAPTAVAEARQREFHARYSDRVRELVRRLESEPGVTAVTVSSVLPGREYPAAIEIDPATQGEGSTRHVARVLHAGLGFFGAFEVPVLTGRGLGAADYGPSSTSVVVNRTFVREVLGDRHAPGRRVRYPGSIERRGNLVPDTWYVIVGVVGDLPANPIAPSETEARIYHPLPDARLYPAAIAIRLRGDSPQAFGPRLRQIAAILDPALRLPAVLPLAEVYRQEQMAIHWGALAFAIVALSVLLVAAAGIYALMSFTVTRRRKEIGIRSALGAHPRRILQSVFARALRQLAIGVAIGSAVAWWLDAATDGEVMGGHSMVLLPVVASIVLAVGLLAALGPARRGLRIQPTEALREE